MVANSGNAKKKIEILLMGERFTVRTDRDERHIEQLSNIVNGQLDDIKRNARTISTHHIALLASLNIADELLRTREALAKAEDRQVMDMMEYQEMKANLANKARATLQEVESALSFLPPEYRVRDERNDNDNESHPSHPDARTIVGG